MTGVILTGGKGSRLGLRTLYQPKAMVDIEGEPMISYVIDNLVWNPGLDKIVILLGENSQSLMTYVRLYTKNQLAKVSYVYDPLACGIVHTLKSIPLDLNERYIVAYCDTILDFNTLMRMKIEEEKDTTILYKKVDDVTPYGTVSTDDGIVTFKEKEDRGPGNALLGYMLFPGNVLDYGLRNSPDSASMPDMLQCIVSRYRIKLMEFTGAFADAGTPIGLKLAAEIVRCNGS